MNLCLLHHQSIVVRCQVSNSGILRCKLNFRSAIQVMELQQTEGVLYSLIIASQTPAQIDIDRVP